MFLNGATRSALIIENVMPDGTKETVIFDLRISQMSYDMNMFDPGRMTIEGYMGPSRAFTQPSPFDDQKEIEPAQLAIESNDDIVIEGEIIEDEVDYEWGFWDSDPDGLPGVWQATMGIRFESYETAKRVGDKSVFGQTVVGRRPRGSNEEWEIVKNG